MRGVVISGEVDGAARLVGPAEGRLVVGVGVEEFSVGVGEAAVVVGAGARWSVGAVRAGVVGFEGEKW